MDKIKQYIDDYWKWLLIGLGILCFILAVLLFLSFSSKSEKQPNSYESTIEELKNEEIIEPEIDKTDVEVENNSEELLTVFVDIKGAVELPGVYEIDSGKRVIDAIDKAGGFKEEADSNSVNLAQLLTDQMVVYVGEKGENINALQENSPENSTQTGQLININLADISELTELNGIGEAKANNIVTYREENGNFNSIDEIKEVSGIGDKIFDGIKEEIVVQ